MTTSDIDSLKDHPVVSHEEWLDARRALLEKEGPKYQYGTGCLADGVLGSWLALVSGVGQVLAPAKVLIGYHFMFHPDDKAGCPHCSLRADGFAGIGAHLNHRDVTMVVVSRAPYQKLADWV